MKHLFLAQLLYLLASTTVWSQSMDYSLNSNESGQTKSYTARDYISLLPGFSYQATGNNTFSARIDAGLLFPPTEGTYALPDGTLTDSPVVGAVAGSIPGQFVLSPMGAATCTLPVEVPSGINGMHPSLSLVYNSQSGNGIAGWGWNLSGIQSISQGVKTIFSDDAAGGIDLSSKSSYFLDGNRLFVQTGFTYGSTGARYETENRTFLQIEQTASSGNYPSKFVVTGKNGVSMEYGQVVKPNNCTYPFQWLLNKTTDANGNSVKYVYKTNTGGTQTVLDYIEYGSNGNAVSPLKIEFGYGVKNYVQKQWVSGYYFEDYYLLESISVKSNGTQLRKYDLSYACRNEKHFLDRVTLTGENGEKLPPTTIEWGEDSPSMWVENKSAVNIVNLPGKLGFFSDDITGDGFSDLIEMRTVGNNTHLRVYQASGTDSCNFTPYGTEKVFPVSLNQHWSRQKAGDFLTLRHYDKKWISMYVSNEHNTFFRLYDPSNTNNNMNTRDIVVSDSYKSLFYTIADFNNDGNDEILYVNRLFSVLFSGTLFYLKQNLPSVSTENIFIHSSNAVLDIIRNVIASDFDADGLIDVAVVGLSGIHIYKNNGGTKQSDGLVHCGFSFAGTVS